MNRSKELSFRSKGRFITSREFHELKNGFTDQFPDDVSSVLIPKQVILECINDAPDAAGISFRYGLGDASDPASRKIILIPCQDITSLTEDPAPILLKEGYLDDRGRRIELDQLWTLLGNHVHRSYSGGGHARLSRIHRAYSWGMGQIKHILDVEGCEGLVFHFGYNPFHPWPCKRNQNVLEAITEEAGSLNIFLEYGQCSPPCDDSSLVEETCLAEAMLRIQGHADAGRQLNTIRSFRDNYLLNQPEGYALYEMYYFISRPLLRAIKAITGPEEVLNVLYNNEMRQCIELIALGRQEDATTHCKDALMRLLDMYAFTASAKEEIIHATDEVIS